MKYKLLLGVSVIAIGAMVLLSSSINQNEADRIELNKTPIVNQLVKHKSEEWAKYYPRQYSSWKRTKRN